MIKREGGEKGRQVLGVQESEGAQRRGLRAHPMEMTGFGMDWSRQEGNPGPHPHSSIPNPDRHLDYQMRGFWKWAHRYPFHICQFLAV